MQHRFSRADAVAVALVGLTTAAGLALWPSLPARMAIHFTPSGTADNYVPRYLGVFLLPAILVVTHLFLRAVVRYDPPRDARLAPTVLVATAGLLAAVHFLVLAWNVGVAVPFELVLLGILCWGAGLVGYVFVRERETR